MKEFKGTKCEWIHSTTPSGKAKVIDNSGFSIANMPAGTATDHANAKLTSAAPDLLEALQEIMVNFKYSELHGLWGEKIMPTDKQLSNSLSAINKALSLNN